jgi:hypothetical protein
MPWSGEKDLGPTIVIRNSIWKLQKIPKNLPKSIEQLNSTDMKQKEKKLCVFLCDFFVFLQTHMVRHRMPQGDTESPTQVSDGRNGNSNKMKHNNGAIQI